MGLEIAAAVGGIGALGGAAIGAGAAGDAADSQVKANRESIAAQKEAAAKAEALLREFNGQARADLAPVQAAQTFGLSQLQGLTDPNSQIYQQQRQVSTEAIQRQLAAQGLLRSRSQGDSLANLELGLEQQRTGLLQGLAGLGGIQQMSQLSSGLGANLAGIQGGLGQQIGSAFQNMGQAQAQRGIQQANAWSGGLAGLGNSLQSVLNPQPSLEQTLAKLLGGNKQQVFGPTAPGSSYGFGSLSAG